jgi:HEAT repeat protein
MKREKFQKLLHHIDPEVRWIAIQDLEKMEGSSITDLLVEALGDTDFESIRWRSAIALGERKDAGSVDALIKALNDENYHVREEVASALGKIADARAIGPLISLLHDPVRSVRLRAIRALERLGEPAKIPLNKALKEGNTTFHTAVLDALREIEDSEVLKRAIKTGKNL